jgi:hypothetical protein
MEMEEKPHSTTEHEHVAEQNGKEDGVGYRRSEEDSITMRDIWKHHKAIIWWSFY